MTDIVINNLSDASLAKLERRARTHGLSVADAAKAIIEAALGSERAAAAETAERIRASLAGREHCDSALLLAKDRGR